jgi:riboflavin kinase/FMN adenylyltransferase
MKIIKENNIKITDETACTIGTFDGIHKAHKKIIDKLKNYPYKSMVITFEPPPKLFFGDRYKNFCNIIDLETKIDIFESLKLDYLFIMKFDENFIKIQASEFLEFLVKSLNCRALIVGYDWKFGYRKEGNIDFLKRFQKIYNYELEIINPVMEDSIRISSSYIRELLKKGYVDKVKNYLGRDYYLKGKIVPGNQIGRRLGFPTLNIKPSEYLCLRKGVYAGFVIYHGIRYKAVINFGYRPTIDGKRLLIEAHILDENLNIENDYIKVIFSKYLREERKFNSLDELSKQIELDILNSKRVLNNLEWR